MNSSSNTAPVTIGIKPTDLPAPPQAEIQIAKACADPDVTSQQLAKLIGSDPVLTAELLRIVNSPFYGVQREISTIAHAVTILGQRALRNLALCLSVRDAMKPESVVGLDLLSYWEDGLREKSGDDPGVADFVLESERGREFFARLCDFVKYLLPHYDEEGKAYLTVGLGCTGGQHRSVAVAIALAEELRKEGRKVRLEHRDKP